MSLDRVESVVGAGRQLDEASYSGFTGYLP